MEEKDLNSNSNGKNAETADFSLNADENAAGTTYLKRSFRK